MKVSKQDSYLEAKSDKAAKKREKIKAIQHKMLGGDEPIIDVLKYDLTLIQALNFYNIYTKDIEKKKWTLDSITDKEIKNGLSKLDDSHFKQLGVLVRLKVRDQPLQEKELNFIDNKIKDLFAQVPVQDPSAIDPNPAVKKVVSMQDKTRTIASDFVTELEGEIDDYIKLGYPKDFTFKNSVKSINGQAAKLVPSFFQDLISELEEALTGECEQLKESYSHLKQVQLRRFITLLKDLITSCNQQIVSAKKPKSIKPKSPIDLVKHLKYLQVYDNMKSESPLRLVDSTEVWLYDTVRRKLTLYKAVKDQKLTVKGTTIIGYDIETSIVKSLRSTESILGLGEMNKKDLRLYLESLKTKPSVPNGRVNAEMIILKAIK